MLKSSQCQSGRTSPRKVWELGDYLVSRTGTAHVQVRKLREVQLPPPFASGLAIPERHCFFPLLQEGTVLSALSLWREPVSLYHQLLLKLSSIRVCDLALD